jgi:hypothetical protein
MRVPICSGPRVTSPDTANRRPNCVVTFSKRGSEPYFSMREAPDHVSAAGEELATGQKLGSSALTFGPAREADVSTDRNASAGDFNLISAIAEGEASSADIARQMRERGINSVEDLIDHMRQTEKRAEEGSRAAISSVDIRRFSVGPDYEPKRDTVHQIPKFPILIDGTLYDPKDINRFDGQELHMVAAPNPIHIVAVTDRVVIGKWWELTYLSSLLHQPFLDPLTSLATTRDGAQLPNNLGPTYAAYTPPTPTVFYREHDNYQGSELSHGKNRGYARLSTVSMGIFSGDWNDKISSLIMQNMLVCKLHDDKYWGGETRTFFGYTPLSPEGPVVYPGNWVPNLRDYGFNDRASSVEAW